MVLDWLLSRPTTRDRGVLDVVSCFCLWCVRDQAVSSARPLLPWQATVKMGGLACNKTGGLGKTDVSPLKISE